MTVPKARQKAVSKAAHGPPGSAIYSLLLANDAERRPRKISAGAVFLDCLAVMGIFTVMILRNESALKTEGRLTWEKVPRC